MAQRFHHFKITRSAGGSVATPTTNRVDFPPGSVAAFEVQVPAGHMHLTGLRIYYGTSQVIPKAENTWLQGNHKTFHFDQEDPVPGGTGWFVETYNADQMYDHSWHVTVELDDLEKGDALLPSVLLLRQTGVGDAGAADAQPIAPGSGGGSGVPV